MSLTSQTTKSVVISSWDFLIYYFFYSLKKSSIILGFLLFFFSFKKTFWSEIHCTFFIYKLVWKTRTNIFFSSSSKKYGES